MLVGTLVWLTASVFVGFSIHSPIGLIAMSVLVTATFGLLGLCAAVVSEKFDQLNIIPSFVLTPLTFLGGVFYSAAMLPEPWSSIVRLNPIFHMVGGLRYALIGVSDTSIGVSWLWVGATTLVSLLATWRLFGRGTRLRT